MFFFFNLHFNCNLWCWEIFFAEGTWIPDLGGQYSAQQGACSEWALLRHTLPHPQALFSEFVIGLYFDTIWAAVCSKLFFIEEPVFALNRLFFCEYHICLAFKNNMNPKKKSNNRKWNVGKRIHKCILRIFFG